MKWNLKSEICRKKDDLKEVLLLLHIYGNYKKPAIFAGLNILYYLFLVVINIIYLLSIAKIKMAPWRGFEPPTLRLTAECSTIELPRNV